MSLNSYKLDAFFRRGRFAEDDPVVITPQGGVAFPVDAIFDRTSIVEDEGMAPVRNHQPMITVATSAVATVAMGDLVTVSGTAYRVIDLVPDGTGVSQVYLERDV